MRLPPGSGGGRIRCERRPICSRASPRRFWMPFTRLLLPALAGLLLLGSSLPAQTSRDKIYSRPEIPSKEALDRLNLHLAWRAYVPTEGGRDALIHTVLEGRDLIVLT